MNAKFNVLVVKKVLYKIWTSILTHKIMTVITETKIYVLDT